MDEQDNTIRQLETTYSCKLCNGILVQAKAIECGHVFCTYCLDLFLTISQNCPQCSSPIEIALPIPIIDEKISNLVTSSAYLQNAYENAKSMRAEKANERSETIKQLQESLSNTNSRSSINTKPKQNVGGSDSLENLCSSLASSIAKSKTQSGRSRPSLLPTLQTPRKVLPPCTQPPLTRKSIPIPIAGRKSDSDISKILSPYQAQPRPTQKPRSRIGVRNNDYRQTLSNDTATTIRRAKETLQKQNEQKEIDREKIEDLFSLYDNFLQSEKGQGGTDFEHTSSNSNSNFGNQTPRFDFFSPRSARTPSFNGGGNEGKTNAKSSGEIDSLLKEAEGVVELDGFVRKWSAQFDNFGPDKADDETDNNVCKEMVVGNRNGSPEVLPPRSRKLTREELSLDPGLLDPISNNEPELTEYDLELDDLKLEMGQMQKLSCKSARSARYDQRPSSSSGFKSGSLTSRRPSEIGVQDWDNSHPRLQVICGDVDDTYEFCEKIRRCKTALANLKNNSKNSSEEIKEFLKSKECNTARLATSSPLQFKSNPTFMLAPRKSSHHSIINPTTINTPRRPKSRAGGGGSGGTSSARFLPPISINRK